TGAADRLADDEGSGEAGHGCRPGPDRAFGFAARARRRGELQRGAEDFGDFGPVGDAENPFDLLPNREDAAGGADALDFARAGADFSRTFGAAQIAAAGLAGEGGTAAPTGAVTFVGELVGAAEGGRRLKRHLLALTDALLVDDEQVAARLIYCKTGD